MSLLASFVFVIAAVVAVAALRLTIVQYSGTAAANIAALWGSSPVREFRFQSLSVVACPSLGGDVVQIKPRMPARRIRLLAGLRAAA